MLSYYICECVYGTIKGCIHGAKFCFEFLSNQFILLNSLRVTSTILNL